MHVFQFAQHAGVQLTEIGEHRLRSHPHGAAAARVVPGGRTGFDRDGGQRQQIEPSNCPIITSRKGGNTDRVTFAVLVDVNGDGKHKTVKLWSLCGPGDNAEPVITIMLEGED